MLSAGRSQRLAPGTREGWRWQRRSTLGAVLWGCSVVGAPGGGVEGTLSQRPGLGREGAASRPGLTLRPKLAALTEHSHSHRCFQKQTERAGASLPPTSDFPSCFLWAWEQACRLHSPRERTGMTVGHVHQGLLCEGQRVRGGPAPASRSTGQPESGGLPTGKRQDEPDARELSQERDWRATAVLENFQGNVGFEPEQGKVENMGFLGMGNKMQRFLDAALELWTTKPWLIGFCSQPQAASHQGQVSLPH